MSKEITITPEDFDIARLVKVGIAENNFKIGKQTITTVMTTYKYLDENDEPCTLYCTWPEQRTFGPSYNFPMDNEDDAKPKGKGKKASSDDEGDAKKEARDPDEATGMQINYPLTSLQSIDKPTKQEKALKRMTDAIQKKVFEDGVEEANKDETCMPGVSVNSFVVGEKKGKPELAVKSIFSPKMTTLPGSDKKVVDKSKPQSAYLKIWTKGKKDKLQSLASFWGPGDRERNPIYFMDTPGLITPTVRFDGAYHGAHAKNPWGTSLRWVVTEATYTPVEAAEKKRRGPINSAPAAEDDSSEDDTPKTKGSKCKPAPKKPVKGGKKAQDSDDEGSEGDFPLEEGGDAKNPLKALAAGKSKGKEEKKKEDAKKPAPKESKNKKSAVSDSDDDSDAKPAPKKEAEAKAGKASAKPEKGKPVAKEAPKKEGKKPVVVDSDDDEPAPVPTKKAESKAGKSAPKEESKTVKPDPKASKGKPAKKATPTESTISDDDSDAKPATKKVEAPKKGGGKKPVIADSDSE